MSDKVKHRQRSGSARRAPPKYSHNEDGFTGGFGPPKKGRDKRDRQKNAWKNDTDNSSGY